MPLLRFGARLVPRCRGAASPGGLPRGSPPVPAGRAGGRGAGAAPRGRGGTGAVPTCWVVPRGLHLGQAVGHGQLQVLVLVLAVRVEADGRGAVGPLRGGRRGRGGARAGEGSLLPPAQLQPQRHVVRDACGTGGKGGYWQRVPTSPNPGVSPPLLDAPQRGAASRPHLPQKSRTCPNPSPDAAPRSPPPKGGGGPQKGEGAGGTASPEAASHHRCGSTSAPRPPPLPRAPARSR